MRIMRSLQTVVLVLGIAAPALAFGKTQNSPVTIWGGKHPVRISVVAGRDDVAAAPTPAKLCAYATPSGVRVDCFQARSSGRAFFGQPKFKIVPFTGSERAVLFTARYSAGGSGSSNLWALLVFGRGHKWKNLLPSLTTSEQSDHLYWSSGDFSSFGLFTVADYVFLKGETHLGAHRYRIRTFELCRSKDTYVLADEFVTKGKYPGLDEADTVRVIEPNLSLIQKRLSEHSQPKECR